MFTGIIQELGRVEELKRSGNVHRLSVAAEGISGDARAGDSVSVNGVCLTVVESSGSQIIVFEITEESLKKTNLAGLKARDRVNLEAPLKLGDKVSGHMVSGHIDRTAKIQRISGSGRTRRIQIELPRELRSYIIPKGSVALDGASLTVGEVGANWFSVYIIPHTFKSTRFGFAKTGDPVNIEPDLMAKYAQGAVSKGKVITETFLKERGFV